MGRILPWTTKEATIAENSQDSQKKAAANGNHDTNKEANDVDHPIADSSGKKVINTDSSNIAIE